MEKEEKEGFYVKVNTDGTFEELIRVIIPRKIYLKKGFRNELLELVAKFDKK